MYRIVWEYEAHPERVAEFEEVYGPEGRWTAFFRRSEDYLGTELFRSTSAAGHFLLVDSWKSRVAYEAFRRGHADEYAALDESCQRLRTRERALGMSEDGR
jgi:quinol monooxygenase YgiN